MKRYYHDSTSSKNQNENKHQKKKKREEPQKVETQPQKTKTQTQLDQVQPPITQPSPNQPDHSTYQQNQPKKLSSSPLSPPSNGPRKKRSLGRVVPWKDWNEWKFVYQLLYSSEPEMNIQGIKRVLGWKLRGRIPIAIESTALFIHILLSEQNQRGSKCFSDPFRCSNQTSYQLEYGMALVRFVNGLVDALQMSAHAKSIRNLAQEISLPQSFVYLRHELSHNSLPSLSVLRSVTQHALLWLQMNYWEAQLKCLDQEAKPYMDTIRFLPEWLEKLFSKSLSSTTVERMVFKYFHDIEPALIRQELCSSILNFILQNGHLSDEQSMGKQYLRVFSNIENKTFPLFRFSLMISFYQSFSAFIPLYFSKENEQTRDPRLEVMFERYSWCLKRFTHWWPHFIPQTVPFRRTLVSQLLQNLDARTVLLIKKLLHGSFNEQERKSIEEIISFFEQYEGLARELDSITAKNQDLKSMVENSEFFQLTSFENEREENLARQAFSLLESSELWSSVKDPHETGWTLCKDWAIGTPIGLLPDGSLPSLQLPQELDLF